jgi:hypothetical protein
VIILGAILTVLALISWEADLYPDSAHGLFFSEGLSTGFAISAAVAWAGAIAAALG